MKHTTTSFFLCLLVLFLAGCKPLGSDQDLKQSEVETLIRDDHSYSNTDEVHTNHLHLELDVNFTNKTVYGIARHQISAHDCDTMILDMKHLTIKKVTLGEGKEDEVEFIIGEYDSLLGQALRIPIKKDTKLVSIYYSTQKGSEAIDWLDPSLTSGKQHPFMYTQGQAILTRSWIPLQDTPLNRITYSANVKVPTGLMAVMSADNPEKISEDGRYRFSMKQAIPAYLIAMAVGNLVHTNLGNHCGIYSEPELSAACAKEFEDIPKMMQIAEDMYGKYQWGHYDVLMLPYSFPFGGMENPRITFANPTLLAGDKSLVSVIAHELAHSWSGNLVTNATWNDFWLNEGFTVYFENRIMEQVYGKEIADILAVVEFQDLETALRDIEESPFPEDSQLKLQLTHRHPDEGMTDIAYVKGAFFLRTLEEIAGRKKFDEFLRKYFKEFAFKTITTEHFIAYLQKELLKPQKINFNSNEWVYQSGLPANCVRITSPRLDKMVNLANELNAGNLNVLKKNKLPKLEKGITQEWQTFIRSLSDKLSPLVMQQIDERLQFSERGNAAVRSDWFLKSVKTGYRAKHKYMQNYLIQTGRRWYVESIYEALMNSKNPADREFARQVYDLAAPGYHFVTKSTIESLVTKKTS